MLRWYYFDPLIWICKLTPVIDVVEFKVRFPQLWWMYSASNNDLVSQNKKFDSENKEERSQSNELVFYNNYLFQKQWGLGSSLITLAEMGLHRFA